MEMYKMLNGDVLEKAKEFEDNTFDALFCDPPYGISFMNKKWDYGLPSTLVWEEMYRVLKPGAFILVFGGPRTFHRLTCYIEDAGFEIRDCLMYVYGKGFPKSYNIGKKVSEWEGYGTALKPAYEPIILARKPVEGNNVKNCLKYGCGGLNIDECRIGYSEKDDPRIGKEYSHNAKSGLENGVHKDNSLGQKQQLHKPQGRWPTNLILDGSEEVEEMFPNSKSTGGQKSLGAFRNGDIYGKGRDERESGDPGYGDNGSSSRFFQKCSYTEQDRIFYSSKVSKKERNAGLENETNSHPTLKPISLCEYLAKLILPPERESSRKIIVPFAGTGSEMAGSLKAGWDEVIGIEYEEEYCEIAEKRIPGLLNNGEKKEKEEAEKKQEKIYVDDLFE